MLGIRIKRERKICLKNENYDKILSVDESLLNDFLVKINIYYNIPSTV